MEEALEFNIVREAQRCEGLVERRELLPLRRRRRCHLRRLTFEIRRHDSYVRDPAGATRRGRE